MGNSYILGYNKWKLNEQATDSKTYTIPNRSNYIYKQAEGEDIWMYQKNGTSSWHPVENKSSVSALNQKSGKKLKAYNPETYEDHTIEGRSNYRYRIDPTGKFWQYQKIGTSTWSTVENKSSISSLNSKYNRSLKPREEGIDLPLNSDSDRSNYKMAKIYIDRNQSKQKDVILALKSACKSVGMNSNATAALISNVGRENGFKWDKIINTHTDPKNKASNLGIISWQGSRKTNLIKQLEDKGLYKNGKVTGSITDVITAMVNFIKKEMEASSSYSWEEFKNSTSTYDAAELLYKYIKYSMGKYNKPDEDFHAWKNHMWAAASKSLNLIDYSYS
jgi:hypothetical protein